MTTNISNTLFAYDCSGSTGNCEYYHSVSDEINSSNDSYTRVRWDTTINFITKNGLKDINSQRRGYGGTSPSCVAKLIKDKNFHGTLIFQSDGQISTSEISLCDSILNGWKFEKVIVHLVETSCKIEESCSIAFTRNSPHEINIYEKHSHNEYEKKTTSISNEDYLILEKIEEIKTIEDFTEKIPALEKILIAVNMGSRANPLLHEKLVKLKNRLIKLKTLEKVDSVTEFENNPSPTTLLKVWNEYYGIVDDWSSYIDRFISWCSGSLLNVLNRSVANRIGRTQVQKFIPPETVEIIEDHFEPKFACPISLEDSSNIIILMKKTEKIMWHDLEKNLQDMLINNPLNGIKNNAVCDFIKSTLDCVISIETYKELVDHGISDTSPLTREEIFGGLCLGDHDTHVRATNSSIKHAFFGGKSLGNMDLWFAVIYFLVEEGKIPHLKEYSELLKRHLVYRIENSKTNMCLSGLNTFPTYKVSLKLALYSVITASSFVRDAKQEPLRLHLQYVDTIISMLKLVNITIPTDIQEYIIYLKIFRYFMSEIKNGNKKISNLIDALKFNAIKTEKMWVLIDGKPKEAQIEDVRSELPLFCGFLRDEKIYDIFQMCDRNKAESDINIPFALPEYEFPTVKNWPYNLDMEATKVDICARTCRPYSNVMYNGIQVNWRTKAKAVYGENFLSINRRFGEYIVKHEKYPTREEFLVYVYEFYSSRNNKTLPICISQFIDEIFEDYNQVLNSVSPSQFIYRWNESAPSSARLYYE